MSLKLLGEQLLERKTLPLQLQHRIFEDALTAKDLAVLERLAGHGDLHPEVDARFVEVSAARVLRVWLDRDGRDLTLANTLAISERRKTVLTVLAAKEGLSDDAYAAMAARGFDQVSATLVCNQAVPTASRGVALRTVIEAVEAGKLSSTHREAAHKALEEMGEELAPLAVEVTKGRAKVGKAIAKHPLDAAHVTMLLDKLEPYAEVLHQRSKNTTYNYQVKNSIGAVAETVSLLALNSELPEGGLERMRRFAERMKDWSEGAASIVKVLEEVAALGAQRKQLVQTARSGSGAKIDEALRTANATAIMSLKRQIVAAALANPAATVDQFTRACEIDRSYTYRGALKEAIRLKDPAKQVAVLKKYPYAVGRVSIDRLSDPLQVCQQMIRGLTKYPHQAQPFIEWMLASGHEREIPALVLTTGSLLSVDGSFERICGPIVTTIAGSQEAWQTLATLVTDFEGTIGEIMDTTLALCPDLTDEASEAEPESGAEPEPEPGSEVESEPPVIPEASKKLEADTGHEQLALL